VDSVVDAQDFKTVNRTAKWAKWINPVTGKRSDAAHAYVHPVLDTQDNLHLFVESKVIRVLFEGTNAVGVEYVPKYIPIPAAARASRDSELTVSKLFAEGEDLSPKVARASKMVVISGGSLSSPQILERSGVGSESLLKSVGLTNIIADLPGVGENLQDHPILAAYFQVNAGPDDTYDDLTIGVKETIERAMKEYKDGKGPLATNFIDAAIKWRPSAEEVKQMSGEFEKYWNASLDGKPDKAAILNCAAAIRPLYCP
jgi:alcohol oxidase